MTSPQSMGQSASPGTGEAPSPQAADALVAHLKAQGVDMVFCVPGESYLAVLDSLHRQGGVQVIACRHEAGAANMAEAYAKLTGKVGVCMVTRGPGATHASVGVHTARQDSTPMLLLIGQVGLADRAREAFQEIDYRAFFGPITKWADEVDSPTRMDEFLARAFQVARAGRAGPVALALPEDVLTAPGGPIAPLARPAPAPMGLSEAVLNEILARLIAAERPVLLLGGSGWSAAGRAAIAQFAGQNDLPTVLSFRRKDLIDNDAPIYCGDLGLGPNPNLIARVKAADLIVCIGARLGENPTQGYSLFSRQETAEKLIHIHPDPEELGKVWPTSLSVVCDGDGAALALSGHAVAGPWGAWRKQARAEYEAWTQPIPVTGAVNLSEIAAHLNAVLPSDAIITNGAGNYAAWLHRFIRHRAGGRQLAPTSGAMGYGVPAAIAAKLAAPNREVIAWAGDGCFLMTGQELATAVQYRANVIILVADNGSYGTIRMHQERAYPGRVIATDLTNPDFVAYAEAFGAFGVRVERTSDFPAAFEKARAAGRPALIHLITAVEDIAPGRTISALRAG
jgi:acetolactate synthase I/II/III large subunit